MDFAAAVDATVLHAKEAALALDNSFKDVLFAPPVPTGSRCVRIFWTGEDDPTERMGSKRDLSGDMQAERLHITGFWSLSNARQGYGATVLNEMRAFKHEFRTRMLLDSTLGGAVADISLQEAAVDFLNLNGTATATVDMDLLLDYEEYGLAQ